MVPAPAFPAAAAALPLRAPEEVLGGRGLVVVAPHPDDEALGCGGMIAAARARGLPVELVFVTDGAGSHPPEAIAPRALAVLRQEEARAAARLLGVAPGALHFLGLPDGAAPREGPGFEHAVAVIRAALETARAGTLLVTWAADPHRDHQAANAMARAACEGREVALLEYPIWGWTLEELPGPPRGMRVDIAAMLPLKRAAIAAHRSQMSDLLPGGARLPEELRARFEAAVEVLLEPFS